jgi:hypothetical protein
VREHGCSSDVALVRAPNWINDQIISFYFEFLRHEVFPGLNKRVLLVPPAITLLLSTLDPVEAKAVLCGLNMPGHELVIFPINNQKDLHATTAGGSHWSTLVMIALTSPPQHATSPATPLDACAPSNKPAPPDTPPKGRRQDVHGGQQPASDVDVQPVQQRGTQCLGSGCVCVHLDSMAGANREAASAVAARAAALIGALLFLVKQYLSPSIVM